jgi:trigger factor
LKLSVERKPQSLVVLDITADDAEFAAAVDTAIKKAARTIQIPGFRKGKAPASRVEKLYGREMFVQEATDEVMQKLYADAIKEADITPVGTPEVDIVQMEPVQFVVTVPVYPEIKLGDYSAVRVDPVDAATTDEDVEEVITRLQKQQSPWVEVTEERSPVDGDQVTVDYEVYDGDTEFQEPIKDAQFVLGETNLLTQLADKLKELKVGEEATFELAFAEDDETADPGIRGKQLRYVVNLKGIKQRQLVEIDDEFAQSVADAASLDDLRRQIRDDIHQGKTTNARSEVVNAIIEKLVEVSELDLPHAMIHEEAHHRVGHLKQEVERSGTPFGAYLRMQNKTEEDLAHELEPEAESRLRSSMIVQEFAKAENLDVTDEDIEAEIAKVLGEAPDPSDEEATAQHNRMSELYNGSYFRQMMRNQLYDQKVTDRLIEIATEGKGAVINAWVAPEPAVDEATDEVVEVAGTVIDEPDEAAAGTTESETAATEAPKAKAGKELAPADGEGTDWVAGDGENNVPDGFPIKGNASSRIYHPVESPNYEKTIAEVYFASPEAAETAGYRLPKTLEKAGEAAGNLAANLADKLTD